MVTSMLKSCSHKITMEEETQTSWHSNIKREEEQIEEEEEEEEEEERKRREEAGGTEVGRGWKQKEREKHGKRATEDNRDK